MRPVLSIHPFHAALLAGTVPLFLGALLSDIAYARTYEIQWANFASWLIVGGLVFGAAALVCAVVDLFRSARAIVSSLLLLLVWALGFVNALVHAKDAWAMMPTGLVLSTVVFVLACAATWVGLSAPHGRGAA